MTIYYKFHTPRFGSDPVDKILELRQEFPGCHFSKGMHKNARGIFCFNDLVNKVYGESFTTPNGDTFWGPADVDGAIAELENYKTDYIERIPVKLCTGITLEIFPASAIPKKVLFSKRVIEENDEAPYNKKDSYGQMAYDLFFDARAGKELSYKDKKFSDFISKILTRSYKLPIEIWDSLEIIGESDLDPLFAAGLGYDFEHLKKTCHNSSQQ
jgi:hypothetical protein